MLPSGLYMQNANESLNNLVWKYCPKTRNHGLIVVQTGTAIAVSIFNDGAAAIIRMLEEMDLHAGKYCHDFCEDKDCFHIKCAERRATEESLKARRVRRRKRLAQQEQQEEAEGFPYQDGGGGLSKAGGMKANIISQNLCPKPVFNF